MGDKDDLRVAAAAGFLLGMAVGLAEEALRQQDQPMSLDVEGRLAMSQWEALHQAQVRERHTDMLECDACRLAGWLGCGVVRNTDDAYMAMQPDCEGQDGPCIRAAMQVDGADFREF